MKRPLTAAASILLSSPLLLLIGGAIVALIVSTSPGEIWRQAQDPAVRDALSLSLRTTLLSLFVVLVSGTAVALLIQRWRGCAGSALEALMTLPAMLPPSVAGFALLIAFGRQGLIGSHLSQMGISVAFSTTAVVMAQTFVAAPFYVREAATAFASMDSDIVDAARLDGADAFALLRYVTLPILAPFLLTGAVLAWARALGEFGATILFAGSLQGVTQTLPLTIYLGFESNLEQAKAIAVILLALALIALIGVRLLSNRPRLTRIQR